MRFIGDVHGQFEGYRALIANVEETIQIGDFGIGYPAYPFPKDILQMPGTHKFFRGNHDDPIECRKHPMYLGDYGVYKDIFYCAGAWTPDFFLGHIWDGEQLEIGELYDALDLYTKTKPRIVATHDCPTEIRMKIMGGYARPTKTDQALHAMFKEWQPKTWVFGHYHRNFRARIDGTLFVCIPILNIFDVE